MNWELAKQALKRRRSVKRKSVPDIILSLDDAGEYIIADIGLSVTHWLPTIFDFDADDWEVVK